MDSLGKVGIKSSAAQHARAFFEQTQQYITSYLNGLTRSRPGETVQEFFLREGVSPAEEALSD
jgi:hypothetical protein